MATWQLQDAKARLSEVVNQAQTEGAQTITRHGVEAAVVISAEEYRILLEKKRSFIEHLLSIPKIEGFAEELEQSRLASRELDRRRQEEIDELFDESNRG